MAMTQTSMQQISRPVGPGRFLAALAPRLPRMVAATAVVMFTAFAAIQFMPQTFEASLLLNLPPGSKPADEAEKLIDQQHLGEVVSRLAPDIVAELRRNGGGVLDTTALLRERLMLTPSGDGTGLNLAVTAGTPARARAIIEAMVKEEARLTEPPPALSQAQTPEAPAAAPTPPPAGENAIASLQEKLSLAWEDRIRLEGRARRIQSLIAEGNYAMLALDSENLPGLGRKLDDLATLEAERDRLAVDLLPNHPKMRTVQEEIDRLSADLSQDMRQLADLAAADRDAARRLEDNLRDQIAAAAATVKADTSVVTGAITERPEPKIAALPRPVRTDLVLALSGGLAFFGQIGLFAFLRQRQQRPAEAIATGTFEQERDIHYAPVATDQADAGWPVDASALTDTAVEARWTAEPAPVLPDAARQAPTSSLDEARIVAIRCRHGKPAAARQLVSRYEQQGKRVVLVDTASRRRGQAAGISDLAQGRASFADVVHGSGTYAVAFVPWGRQAQLDPSARQVRILIEALRELYDVVILALDSDNLAAAAPLAALADATIEADAISAPPGLAA